MGQALVSVLVEPPKISESTNNIMCQVPEEDSIGQQKETETI